MSTAPEGSPQLPAEEEYASLRLPLPFARQELIRGAVEEYGVDEEVLISLFGEPDIEAYFSNPDNAGDLGGDNAA